MTGLHIALRTVHTVGALGRLIKIEHSVFALPFAYSGAFLAARGWPGWRAMLLLTLAMVAIRSFAMTVNRLADLKYDMQNPRSQDWGLVTGEVKRWQAWVFLLVMAGIFVLACFGLNERSLMLAPVALILSGFYSFTKRFTWLCHFMLGIVLGLAPVAGWISVSSEVAITPFLLFFTVVFWVAGFDILYALQDVSFDKALQLSSVPVKFGVPSALIVSSACHVHTVIFLFLIGLASSLSIAWYIVCLVVTVALCVEHCLISERDISRINAAFFLVNGLISIVIFFGILLGIYLL